MEFREIIIIFGMVAILVILWDGFRRMKLKPKKPKARVEPEDDWVDPEEAAKKAQIARELPNGGARTREMTEEEKKEISSKFKLNLRERVPMLMERVVVEGEESDAERLEKEAESNEQDHKSEEKAVQSELDLTVNDSEPEEPQTNPDAPAELESNSDSEQETDRRLSTETMSFSATNDDMLVDHKTPVTDENSSEAQASEMEIVSELSPELEQASVESDLVDMEPDTEPKTEAPLPVEDLIVVHVMAKDGGEINGQALLELLVHSGLRHGPMDIFHYRNPNGKTEFSLANCVQPGTFNPDAMADVNTPGVTLFLQLPCTADAMESFEHMIEMAKFMAGHLNAELLDEDHNGVTPQVVEYYREKLRAFTRKQLIPS